MQKHKVIITETIRYTAEIMADDEEDARQQAEFKAEDGELDDCCPELVERSITIEEPNLRAEAPGSTTPTNTDHAQES